MTHKHTTDIMYPILEKRLLAEGIWLMKVLAPRVARSAQPGQFVIVRVDEHGERIPLTISDFDAAEGSVTIVTQAIGASTRKICALNEGDALADTQALADTLSEVGFPCHLEVWGGDVSHDWYWWGKMWSLFAPRILEVK